MYYLNKQSSMLMFPFSLVKDFDCTSTYDKFVSSYVLQKKISIALEEKQV
jgi:hypothetical protein